MKKIYLAVLLLLIPLFSNAQALTTDYFVKSSSGRHFLNPAFAPMHGYVGVPLMANLSLSLESNLSVDKLFYPVDGKLATFLHPDVSAEEFLGSLRRNNNLNLSAYTPVISTGWFTKRGSFWTAGIFVKSEMESNLPYGLFDFLKRGMYSATDTRYTIENLRIRENAYIETYVGYSRMIFDNLRVGAKLKARTGLAYFETNIDRMDITMSKDVWQVRSDATMNMASKLVRFKEDSDSPVGFVPEFGSVGVSGFGMAIDLGAEYSFKGLLEGLNVSASVTDLGFMTYPSADVVSKKASGDVVYDGFGNIDLENPNMEDQLEELTGMFYDMIDFQDQPSAGMTRMLSAKFYLGAEYELLDDMMSVGLLYQGRTGMKRYWNEMTVSYNLRPVDWFAFSASYSFLNVYNRLGWAIHLTPPYGVNFYIGSDYTFFNYAPPYIPLKGSYFNFEFGLNIPIQGGKMKAMRASGNFMN